MKNIVIKPIALCSTLVIIEIHTVIHKETIGVPMKKTTNIILPTYPAMNEGWDF